MRVWLISSSLTFAFGAFFFLALLLLCVTGADVSGMTMFGDIVTSMMLAGGGATLLGLLAYALD